MTVPRNLLERSRRALAGDRPSHAGEHESPGVGSLVVLGDSDLPVEWLLIEKRGDGFWAVAVDSAPWAGAADRRLEQTPECPQGVVRSHIGFRVPLGALAGRAGSARVHPRDLEKIVQHHMTGSRPMAISSHALETDLEPEFRAWLRTLAAERDRLSTEIDTSLAGETSPLRVVDWVRAGTWRTWQVAAALVLTTTLAWAIGRQTLQKDLADLQRALDIAQATAQAAQGPQINLPIAWLGTRSIERGDADVTTLEPGVDWMLFLVEVPRLASTYRLILFDAEGASVTTLDGLRPSSTGELSLALPAALFETGLYRVRVEVDPGIAASPEGLELWFRVQKPMP